MCSTRSKNITVHIFGKPYSIPAGLTILHAMEYVGYTSTHECGCRGGICGGCVVAVKKKGKPGTEYVLACRTAAEDGIYVELPQKKQPLQREYDIQNIDMSVNSILRLYPEINNCVGCGLCTRVCPNNIDVMMYITYIQNGDIDKCAEISLGCIMCGICSISCPAGINHCHAALFARRINGKYLIPKSELLDKRITEVNNGNFSCKINELEKMTIDELKNIYRQQKAEG